jgi:WhiB family redox-sensing transcriptional regulator
MLVNATTVQLAHGLSSLCRTIIVQFRGLPMSDMYASFQNTAACASHDPELWFPQEKSGTRNWTRTPDAIRARTICASCPARQECLEYSLKYTGLYGIWAGLDWYERREIQEKEQIETTEWVSTFTFSQFHDRNSANEEQG